ncbi:Na/Pi symporter [Falsiroseomonas tokyonensis]|uniref:Na/Pi symporter n=1 Tax=Falsiroseomonas tokyonensis TaxID=430521 RepID=A0ABV7BSI8_9PROT|nr:Na/Pi symporter [Falsiroseomonas tokyonensis]MBU8537999.1 Na/Pi cotransporter family protein [Falsiroseomonas tokyonensis]
MELIAALLGGIGLFLIGIKGLGSSLQALAGPRMRAVVAHATSNPLRAAATGLLLGGLTQSSNAVTFILTAMIQSGLLGLRRALPIAAFANPGTAGLVLLATVDIRLAVLWLIGLVGLSSALNLDRSGRLKPALGALLGLALMFLGLDLLKTAAVPLRELPLLASMAGGAGLALPFLAGAGVTLLAQSSSTVSILALTLHAAGLLGFEQAALAVYGASLGSGGAVLLLSAGLAGAARRLAVFQALVKAAGAALFLGLFVLERLAGLPLVLAATTELAPDPQARIGLLFLLLQLVSALLGVMAPASMAALLTRLCPDSPAEAASRPQFLYDRALDDPPTALELVAREQQRLALRLPAFVDPLRAEPELPPEPAGTGQAASRALEGAIGRFLAELLTRGGDRDVLDRVLALEAANAGLAALRETLSEFAATARQGTAAAPLRPTLERLAEALHLLLGALAEARDATDAEMLRDMADDRGTLMAGLRQRLAEREPELTAEARALLLAATAQFERAVWLVRRQAQLSLA